MRTKNITILLVSLIALIALGLGIYAFNKKENLNEKLVAATVYTSPREIMSFELVNDENKPFTNQNLQNHWNLIFFGFTHCHGICPATMAQLAKAYVIIEKKHVQTPQVIMISIDPENDTVTRLHEYVRGFNPNFLGIRGNPSQIDALTKNFNVLYLRSNSKNSDTIDHSGTVTLVNPQGKVAAIFSMPHDADKIAQDYVTIVKHFS